ncbi:N-terminal domain of tricorn protease-containing protein [Cnuella takakiae]|uniref:Tricorn protease homolog n=1 Tax=Cnuella takakiae TaxID=1302690 RepID=A0A1M5DXS4_9BACT|nr:S41 family peptidase [Cnuella takakiae]OLY93837.1 peptidase S41 [Cnuella takakiae]SHF71631.1 N-terminal domain of tricorn protease-containing protein [Cnuella takakiae]
MNKYLMKWAAPVVLLVSGLCTHAQTNSEPTAKPYFAEPALSPDGREFAFTSGGDIWTVPAAGGEARLLVSHPDNDGRPLYSPDGKFLAFTSTRTGNGDIYLLNLATSELKRLTYDDGADELSAWSADGKYLYFATSSREVSSMRDIYRVQAGGGTPMPVSNRRYMSEFFGAPSPDGKTLAFAARGIAAQQWWRKGSSHLDESELWLLHEGKTPRYEQLTERKGRELWPMWSSDGKTLYYVSDVSGAQNLWALPVGGTPRQLTTFTNGRVLWPAIGNKGQQIVFEKEFGIWSFDLASGKAAPLNIARRGAPAALGTEHLRLSNGFRDMALSPDGKKAAFIARGEVFVASAKDGGDAVRITNTGATESSISWAPNSNSIVYVSERSGAANLYQYDFVTSKETQLTSTKDEDAAPLFAPNGKQLAFIRNGKELKVLDLATRKETTVTTGYFGRQPFAANGRICWSPDNKWLAFAGYGAKSFRNIYVVPASGGNATPVSFLANTFGGSLNWSADGSYLLFTTAQRTEDANVARIDLVPQSPRFREDQFQQLFSETPSTPTSLNTKPAPESKPADSLAAATTAKGKNEVKIITEGIRQRLSLLPLNADVNEQLLSKDGKTLLVIANIAGQTNLYTYSLDELAKEPAVLTQVTATPGFKSNLQITRDGKTAYYLEQGRIQSVSLDTKAAKPVAVTAELDVDFNKERTVLFRQAWEAQHKGFYDSTFHGADWNAVYTQYEPYAAGAGTPDELRRVISLMVGELNASHSGISAPPAGASFTTGRLGLYFDREAYEDKGLFLVTEVVNLGPAAITGRVKAGDYLLAVDDKPIPANTDLAQLLENKGGKKLTLTFSNSTSGSNPFKVSLRPVNTATEKGLLYKQWVQEQREYVARVSKGRLGYVHMYDMSQQSLDQLYLDMDAENHAREGVVVDVRNNNGGFVNAYALDVLARKGYMTMQVRGLPQAPARTQLGQRALEAPTVLVTNQHSLSDAEDFTEGYRTLGLGKVVGEPTGGWIIYTSSTTLLDGSTLRLPFIKVTDHEGKNMELAPRPVDIPVSRSYNEGNGKDSQLDKAVEVLLKSLEDAKLSKR